MKQKKKQALLLIFLIFPFFFALIVYFILFFLYKLQIHIQVIQVKVFVAAIYHLMGQKLVLILVTMKQLVMMELIIKLVDIHTTVVQQLMHQHYHKVSMQQCTIQLINFLWCKTVILEVIMYKKKIYKKIKNAILYIKKISHTCNLIIYIYMHIY